MMKKSFNTNEGRPEFPRNEVRSAISRGIQQAEDLLQEKPKRKRKPFVYVGSAAVIAFGLLVGTSYISPALASTLSRLPIIGSVFSDSGLIGLKRASEQGLTSVIGETQTIDGISVTVDEVLYDQTNITVGFTVESKKELSEHYFGAGMNFTINGETFNMSGSHHEKIVSPTVRTGITDFNVTEEMPESFELGMVLEGESGEKWMFSTPIEEISDVEHITVNHKQQAEGIHLDVSELSLSPSSVGISFEASQQGNLDDRVETSFIEFRMTDEHGKEIISHSGGVKGEFNDGKWVFNGNKTFDPINNDVKELTITPYLMLPTGGSSAEINENGEEIVTEFDGSSLKEVKFKPFTVTLPTK
jgi:hypothetical protein